MSNHHSEDCKIAYVAIKRHRPRGATFAYLPSLDIQLPEGWEWAVIDGKVNTMDVTEIGYGLTLDQTCRMMCKGTGVTWPKREEVE